MTPPADLGFPSLYLQPLKTALGSAWPRPRVRRIMEDLENVQKRMAELTMRMNGINKTPKEQRHDRLSAWNEEYNLAQRELARLMSQFEKMPVTKEQFKRPDAELSECCDAYIRPVSTDVNGMQLAKDTHVCVDCGNFCHTYTRLEREEWAKEYREAMEDHKQETEEQMKERKQLEDIKKGITGAPPSKKPLSSGYLIT